METRTALLIALSVGLIPACVPPGPAAAPAKAEAKDDAQVDQDRLALERRRFQLEKQLLTELRKLRESRQASTGDAQPAHEEEPASANDCELMVFGGSIHDVFLGCLSDEDRADSVFNMGGEHGSDLSPISIRNKFAPYGSNYDDTSACNAGAKHPPLVVASDGKSLGLLTVNAELKRRIAVPSVADWLALMCGQ